MRVSLELRMLYYVELEWRLQGAKSLMGFLEM